MRFLPRSSPRVAADSDALQKASNKTLAALRVEERMEIQLAAFLDEKTRVQKLLAEVGERIAQVNREVERAEQDYAAAWGEQHQICKMVAPVPQELCNGRV